MISLKIIINAAQYFDSLFLAARGYTNQIHNYKAVYFSAIILFYKHFNFLLLMPSSIYPSKFKLIYSFLRLTI